MSELVSIIVPIYNAQKFLKECIDSILDQTYQNLEIILVDDGSKDDSGKICDYYAKVDSRIKVFHQENKGLSAARNKGIKNSHGDYIAFIDADDYLSHNMIEVLLQSIKKNDADLSMCSFQYVNEFGERLKENVSPILDEVLNVDEALSKLFKEKNWYYIVAWNKLYKKELWNDIQYPIDFIHEDEAVIHHILYKCKKVVTVKQELLFYRQVNSSIMHNLNVKRTDIYYALADRLAFLEDKVSNEKIKKLSVQYWYCYLDDFFRYYSDSENKKYIRRMKKSLWKAMPVMQRCGYLTLRDVMGLYLFLLNPILYKKLFMR